MLLYGCVIAGQPAKELSVLLCTDPQQQHLLTPQHIQPDAGQTPSAAAAGVNLTSAGFTTPTRKPPSTAAKGSSSKKAKSSSKSSKKQQQTDTKQGSSSTAPNPAAQWQLQLLQDGLDWSKPRQRQLLQQLIHKQLMGCSYLPGNVIYVPLLGAQVLCWLLPTADSVQQQQQQVLLAGAQQPISIQQLPMQVTFNTQLQLLPPNEQQPGLPALQAVLGMQQAAVDSTAAKERASVVGASAGSGSLQQQIAATREAAAAAVGGSAEEAAMQAAERAVRAGGWGKGWILSHEPVICASEWLTVSVQLFIRRCSGSCPACLHVGM